MTTEPDIAPPLDTRRADRRRGITGDTGAGTLRDEGAASVFAVVSVSILVMFVGIAVDLSGALHATQRAQDTARQAARTGAEAARGGDSMRGDAASVDPARGAAAARRYLSDAGVLGTVQVSANAVTVRAEGTYRPVLLGLAGVGAITVDGESTASLERVLTGAQR